ncbi:chemotaxis protein CheA [Gluconobacter cerinus]|uniref:chemotaxis protein CheA n=1 Tax=Gluconobacter cerinus TaxID=38307 RepID=UPI00193F128E|nr:chemotaxis protein CheA [Gluconobacter cerinus]MBM3097991.1 chemotaxis protein CheA [Gluconobacter cerinus]
MNDQDSLGEIRQIFFQECEENLSVLEEELGSIESSQDKFSKINAIFRAVHSIKGGAGAFGMEKLVRISHLFEEVLDKFRSGFRNIDQDAVVIFLKTTDCLAEIISFYRSGSELIETNDICDDLCRYLNDTGVSDRDSKFISNLTKEIDEFEFHPVKIDLGLPQENTFYIEISPTLSFYSHGDDVPNLFIFLQKKGVLTVELDAAKIPSLTSFATDVCYLKWTIILRTSEARENIEEIFEWSGGDLSYEFIESPSATDSLELKFLPITKHENSNDGLVGPMAVNRDHQYNNKEYSTVRIDTSRVDKLVDLVSELIINQGAIRSQMKLSNVLSGSSLDIAISELNQLTQELQENVMAMRAHPIKAVFQRMNRIVREAARLSGKNVVFHTEGEEVEIDRSIMEKLSEPLMHLIRNAIDHGIEEPNVRDDNGKSKEGNLYLRAFIRSGRFVIEVEDDGGGLNSDKIYEKALSRGIIVPGSHLEKEEIQSLIFSPGFSTLDVVSDLSGRGVGMDVVKKNIFEMGGKISVSSEEKKGTKFLISLPMTLSVLEGLIFKIEEQKFIAPINNVIEAFLLNEKKIFRISEFDMKYLYRNELIPISFKKKNDSSICLILENDQKIKHAIIVDELIDQSRFVIKSIESNYKKIPGFSSSSILGDGSVALIIDVDCYIDNFI